MNINQFIIDHLTESANTKRRIAEQCTDEIERVADAIVTCFRSERKLLICGNGGSAADAQHIAAEFVIRLSHDVQRPALPAIALTTDTSQLTAGGNDIGFDNVFSRQVEAYGRAGDILLGISTSGNSENIVRAVTMAKSRRMITIGLLGGQGGKLAGMLDRMVIVPSKNTQHIQEGHITIGHIVCELVERTLFT